MIFYSIAVDFLLSRIYIYVTVYLINIADVDSINNSFVYENYINMDITRF